MGTNYGEIQKYKNRYENNEKLNSNNCLTNYESVLLPIA